MPRVLSDLTAGQSVYVDTLSDGETVSTEFIYLGESDDGAAALLLWAGIPFSKQMHSSNVAEYRDCTLRTYLTSSDGGFIDTYLPAALQNCLVSSQYSYYSVSNEALITLTDSVRLLTYTECGWSFSYNEGSSRLPALKTWSNASSDNGARIAYNSAQSAVNWWLLSAYSESQLRYVSTGGNAVSSSASVSYGIRPVLSVDKSTIVSDDTEDTIYLYPDEAKTYRELDAIVYIGSTASRPKQARLTLPITNLYDTKLCVSNNVKDSEPVWAETTSGEVVELTNETKETDEWELGIMFYGKSNGYGYIGEPIVIVEEETS